jgi:hypothetical protein
VSGRSDRRHGREPASRIGARPIPDRTGLLTAVAVSLLIIGVGLLAFALYGRTGPPQPSVTEVIPDSETAPPPVAVAPRVATRVLPRSEPVRIEIPSIKVRAKVTALGLKPDGSLEVPSLTRVQDTGWYKLGPAPGERGPAVLSGHVDSATGPGVFYRLGAVKLGARVKVWRADRKALSFRITHIDRVDKRRFPTSRVYGPIDYAGLRLITCGGTFDRRTGQYRDNIIAYGELTR